MKYELNELTVKTWPDWSPKDFIMKELTLEEWDEYIQKYPNLLWGTHVYDRKKNKLMVCRFVSKIKCKQYCTGPTLCDEGSVL